MSEEGLGGIIAALSDGGVEFILIGGLAVGWHGYIRATKDVDVVPAPDSQNLERLASVLAQLDAKVAGADDFDPGELPSPADPSTLRLGGNWVLETRGGRLDIMQLVAPELEYEMLAGRAVAGEVFGRPIRVCGYEDLVAMKEAAGREEDRLDLKRLREARGG